MVVMALATTITTAPILNLPGVEDRSLAQPKPVVAVTRAA